MDDRRFRAIVLAGSAIWCLMVVAAPVFKIDSIYRFFSTICHQNPLRSLHIAGSPLAVCIRCSCIYAGFFLAALCSLKPNRALLKTAIALTILEFILARLLVDSAWLRGATGLFLGIEAAPFVIVGIRQMMQTRFGREAV